MGFGEFIIRRINMHFDWMGARSVLWHLAKGESEEAAWEVASVPVPLPVP